MPLQVNSCAAATSLPSTDVEGTPLSALDEDRFDSCMEWLDELDVDGENEQEIAKTIETLLRQSSEYRGELRALNESNVVSWLECACEKWKHPQK